MKDQRWWRSTIARRTALVAAFVFMLFAVVIARVGVADSITGQFPWAGHWVTSVVLGIGSLALGFFYFGGERNNTE